MSWSTICLAMGWSLTPHVQVMNCIMSRSWSIYWQDSAQEEEARFAVTMCRIVNAEFERMPLAELVDIAKAHCLEMSDGDGPEEYRSSVVEHLFFGHCLSWVDTLVSDDPQDSGGRRLNLPTPGVFTFVVVASSAARLNKLSGVGDYHVANPKLLAKLKWVLHFTCPRGAAELRTTSRMFKPKVIYWAVGRHGFPCGGYSGWFFVSSIIQVPRQQMKKTIRKLSVMPPCPSSSFNVFTPFFGIQDKGMSIVASSIGCTDDERSHRSVIASRLLASIKPQEMAVYQSSILVNVVDLDIVETAEWDLLVGDDIVRAYEDIFNTHSGGEDRSHPDLEMEQSTPCSILVESGCDEQEHRNKAGTCVGSAQGDPIMSLMDRVIGEPSVSPADDPVDRHNTASCMADGTGLCNNVDTTTQEDSEHVVSGTSGDSSMPAVNELSVLLLGHMGQGSAVSLFDCDPARLYDIAREHGLSVRAKDGLDAIRLMILRHLLLGDCFR
ncbi:uncharacterized protein EV420DRAFT_1482082 [Desarmillaria tabescens]|uniref:Uncharacterized protein n=1 Tax=Armillaria tabescens TaxID=1929756 RepID=A0AA39K3I3_ARMTA|nr:uncharacterized protein EV420DRAFT_1482082 [Desarmillaria tabescens]KAK0452775.1 hypothetical protein EV420DRAFT_1482082 [Desarmillaria tabescens]